MSYRLYIPTSLEEALDLKRRTGGTYLAAGTVLLVNHRHAEDLISLERVEGLNVIEDRGESVSIGSLVTFDQIEKSRCIKESFPALWQAAFETAGPHIRNRATIGGNIGCLSPASDAVTALAALDAQVEIFDGSYHIIPIDGLEELEDGAIITAVIIAKRFGFSAFEKVGKRNAMSVSVLNMAISESSGDVRLAAGCVSRRVILCKATSEILSQKPFDIEKAKQALLSEIHPIEDRWGTVEYRRIVACNLLQKFVKEAGL